MKTFKTWFGRVVTFAGGVLAVVGIIQVNRFLALGLVVVVIGLLLEGE